MVSRSQDEREGSLCPIEDLCVAALIFMISRTNRLTKIGYPVVFRFKSLLA
jgi:hypothetical protein